MKMWRSYAKRDSPLSQRWSAHERRDSLIFLGRGRLPVPLNYYGAHTGRWSASKGSGLNLQNLKRGSFLRKSIMAPDGYTLVVCDLSQIEPRVLAWLADYEALLNIFSSGQDAYAHVRCADVWYTRA
jgi:DNA polymerase I-like protein with 3'-5' exonuclease and polymerase domains